MTAALEGDALYPGKDPDGLDGPQVQSGRAENLVPTGIRSRTLQPVASRYTDWATRTMLGKVSRVNYCSQSFLV
jgi:hypothetical protein